jgi:hypothetical protein
MSFNKIFTFLYFLTLIIFFPISAYAYLDPGTGGLIIQVLIASLVGIGVFFKNIKNKFLRLFKKKKKK